MSGALSGNGAAHVRAVGSRGRVGRRQGTRCEGILRDIAKRALDCAAPAPVSGHTHEAHAAQGARAHECLRYMSSRVGMSRGAGSSDLYVSRLFFFASHDADLSLIHSKASSSV